MSSEHTHTEEFIQRFKEVCGTNRPKVIAELLDISNSAAKNYLQGRLPDSNILIKIAKKTPFSIHWLLTGEGDKFADRSVKNKLDIFLENLTGIVSSDVLLEFGEVLAEFRSKNRHTSTASPKTVILTPDKVRKEKVKEKKTKNLPFKSS